MEPGIVAADLIAHGISSENTRVNGEVDVVAICQLSIGFIESVECTWPFADAHALLGDQRGSTFFLMFS